MKYIRAIGRPDPDRVPEFFHVISGSPYVTETRLFDLNIPPSGRPTGLFEVEGDLERFREKLGDLAGIRAFDTAPITEDRFNLLVTLDPSTQPFLQDLLGAITEEGLVVSMPVIYRDGQVHPRIVGSSAALQRAIHKFPKGADLEITAVGEFTRSRETPLSILSARQREALVTAYNLGYYEHPRETDHGEIAARLGCAPNTVSDHLQKAEKKIMGEIIDLERAQK